MLYGGEKAPTEVFSNIFSECKKFNDPYFLVQANAYPLSEVLKDPCCLEDDCNLSCQPKCECCNPCCDAYCEPFSYIFAEICLTGTIKVIRFTCEEIRAKSCAEPKKCECCSDVSAQPTSVRKEKRKGRSEHFRCGLRPSFQLDYLCGNMQGALVTTASQIRVACGLASRQIWVTP